VLRPARVKTRDSLSPEPTSEPKPDAVSDDELEHQRPRLTLWRAASGSDRCPYPFAASLRGVGF